MIPGKSLPAESIWWLPPVAPFDSKCYSLFQNTKTVNNVRVLSTELAVSIKLFVCERSPSPFWFFLTRFDFIIVWIMVIIANYNLLFRLLGATFFIWRALECTVHCFRMHAFAIQLVINWIYSWHVSLLFRFSSSAHTGWTKQKRKSESFRMRALPLHWNQCDRLRYWIWFSDCTLAHWVCSVWKP